MNEFNFPEVIYITNYYDPMKVLKLTLNGNFKLGETACAYYGDKKNYYLMSTFMDLCHYEDINGSQQFSYHSNLNEAMAWVEDYYREQLLSAQKTIEKITGILSGGFKIIEENKGE
jgi:hypothetical protein